MAGGARTMHLGQKAQIQTQSLCLTQLFCHFYFRNRTKTEFFSDRGSRAPHASSPRYAVLRVATSLLIYKQLAPLTFLNKVSENYYTLQEAVKSTYRQDLRYIAGHYFHWSPLKRQCGAILIIFFYSLIEAKKIFANFFFDKILYSVQLQNNWLDLEKNGGKLRAG